MIKKAKQFLKKKITFDSNDILKIITISILCILLISRKYNLQVVTSIITITLILYYFTNSILTSLLISSLITYASLTYFYKLKLENFLSLTQEKKKREKKMNRNLNKNIKKFKKVLKNMPSSIRSKWEKAYKNQLSLKTFEDWKKTIGIKNINEAQYYFYDYDFYKDFVPYSKKIEKYAEQYIENNKY